MPANLKSIVRQLKVLLNRPSELAFGIPKIQQEIWRATEEDDPQWEILRDLAYDLDFFQPDERVRSEDKSLYREERALTEIREALAKLEAAG